MKTNFHKKNFALEEEVDMNSEMAYRHQSHEEKLTVLWNTAGWSMWTNAKIINGVQYGS